MIFILADDLGGADLSVYGQNQYETPHLDRLAAQGGRFTQAYAKSAVCSVTRFALITGRYQYRLPGGMEEPLLSTGHHLGLPPEHPTLPSLLKAVGYTTALIGKWHLGTLPHCGPLKSGYDGFFGNCRGSLDCFTHKPGVGEHVPHDLYEGEVPLERVGSYTRILAHESSKYIKTMSSKVRHTPSCCRCISRHPTGPGRGQWMRLCPAPSRTCSIITAGTSKPTPR
ncbi:MAG TPA: sulfatase-like hydrolase/transferase [Candidatus Tectomicrobia bacterium]|nr:sulfatase-like hydrolase/transferase [Candidatus Tectomicrobia bacterium]